MEATGLKSVGITLTK